MDENGAMAPVDRIGQTAGKVWRYLQESGAASLTGLAQHLQEPRDLVMQAIGWLAREGKVEIKESGRTKMITLRSE